MLLRKGFEEDDIKLLIDDDDSCDMPNHVNVKKALNWLTQNRSEDDILFMHFSGHGTQVPADDDDDEEDNLDEAIVLDELFLMADDDLKQFFSQVPEGTRVTVVTDCCHSGTMLDGTQVVIEGPKDSSSAVAQEESDELIDALGGSRGYEISENRSLPIETIASVMSAKLGGADVQPNKSGVSGALAQVFGGTSGKFMYQYALKFLGKNDDSGQMSSMVSGVLGSMMGGGSSGGGSDLVGGLMSKFMGGSQPEPQQESNPLGGLMSSFMGGGSQPEPKQESNPLGGLMSSFMGGGSQPEPQQESNPLGGMMSSLMGGSNQSQSQPQQSDNPMSAVMGVMNQFGLGGMEGHTSSDIPPYNPNPKSVSRETTVLITGCQSDETSADVRPANGDAYGALTKTLTDIQSKDPNISYYDLVSHVRSTLSAGGFSQNPCLETSEDRASEPFICES